ncbi:RDD family protein [Cupriavidus sp. AU9028]|uniref:RDD family protein n=1 Tax=Cupriavidus sp. AU9028 TaxID=2871157 RepID=UPI001C96B1BD|nr:RDD family protein [Cupriavidus sp. AU9028]MBY4895734.1 RDD family protein [Cupriavidus sp. AU9028]
MPAPPTHAAAARPSPAKPATSAHDLAVPTLRRRLACMLYEGVLLFGVLSASTAAYLAARPLLASIDVDSTLTMQLWSFLVLGAYFVWFWQRNGQTLAMQTWRIRVVDAGGAPPGWKRAALRYLLAWSWLPPAAALGHLLGLVRGPFVAVLAAALAIWILLARLDRQRQFLHDRLAGTRLVEVPKGGAGPASSTG